MLEVLVLGWALLLILLICPIMMLFMHGGHKKHNAGDNTGKNHVHRHQNHSSDVQSLDSYKVKQLEGEIEFLKTQNELLQKEVKNFTNNIPKSNKIF